MALSPDYNKYHQNIPPNDLSKEKDQLEKSLQEEKVDKEAKSIIGNVVQSNANESAEQSNENEDDLFISAISIDSRDFRSFDELTSTSNTTTEISDSHSEVLPSSSSRIPLNFEEEKVKELFAKAIEDRYKKADYERLGFLKLSRQKTGLQHSYYIQRLESKAENSLSFRIHQVIHGKEGIIGEGGMKIAKKWVAIDTGDLIVRAYFKNKNAFTVKHRYPDLAPILKELKENPIPFTAPGQLIEITCSKIRKGCLVRASIVTEYAESDLEKEIEAQRLSSENKQLYVYQVLTAVNELHKRGIVHRDLKTGNILINKKTAYVTDFDFAVKKVPTGNTPGAKGYMSPEALRNEVRTNEDAQKNDAYATGVILYEVFHGQHPMINKLLPNPDVFQNFSEGDFKKAWIAKHGPVGEGSIDELIFSLMNPNSKARLTVDQALTKYRSIYPSLPQQV